MELKINSQVPAKHPRKKNKRGKRSKQNQQKFLISVPEPIGENATGFFKAALDPGVEKPLLEIYRLSDLSLMEDLPLRGHHQLVLAIVFSADNADDPALKDLHRLRNTQNIGILLLAVFG